MLAHVAFPIVDLRVFAPDEAGKLPDPYFPFVEAGRDFVRATGSVRPRPLGGTRHWTGDQYYCDAARAVRFRADGNRHLPWPWDVAFRRLVDTGWEWPVASFELGFSTRYGNRSGADVIELLGTRVRVGGGPEVVLGTAAVELAGHYARATTRHRAERQGESLVHGGRPLLVVDGDVGETRELVEWVTAARPGPDGTDARLRHDDVEAWFGPRPSTPRHAQVLLVVGRAGKGKRSARRNVRLHLIRIYCTAVALFHLHKKLRSGEVPRDWPQPSGQRLQQFLHDAKRVLTRGSPLDVEPTELLARLTEWARLASGGDYDDLLALTEGIRPNIHRGLEELVGGLRDPRIEVTVVQGDQYRSDGDQHIVQGNIGSAAIGSDAVNIVEGDVNQDITDVRGGVARLERVVGGLPDQARAELEALVAELRDHVGRDRADPEKTRSLLRRVADRAKEVGAVAKPVLDIVASVLRITA